MKRSRGLTVSEVLVALVLFGVILLVVSPIIGMFRLNRNSSQTLSATAQAQNVLERIQGQWSLTNASAINSARTNDPGTRRYVGTCFNPPDFPSNTQVTVDAVDINGNVTGPLPYTISSNCATAPQNPTPFKRVNVTVTGLIQGNSTPVVLARASLIIGNPDLNPTPDP